MRSFLSDTLPEGWVAATLGEVSILNPQRGDFSNIKEGDDVSFIPMSAVDDVAGPVTSMQSRPFREVQRGFTSFIEGDILFAKITPCMENGKTAIATNLRSGIGFGSTEFHVLRTVSPVTAKYVYYFLRQTVFREAAKGHMTGTGGLKRVPAKWLSTHPIPLPPLSEQSRIGVKLDAAMQEAKAAQSQLADGFASVVNMRHQALTGACSGKLTSDWRLKHGVPDWGQTSIGDLSSLVTSGSRGWAEYYSDAGPLFIRAQNISDDCLDLSDVAHVMPPQQVEGARTRVAKNDLLITITGGNVAKTGLVETELEEAYVSQHVALVRLQDFRNARFLFLWLRSPEHGRGELLREAQHSDKPGLSLIAVRNVKISQGGGRHDAGRHFGGRSQLDTTAKRGKHASRVRSGISW